MQDLTRAEIASKEDDIGNRNINEMLQPHCNEITSLNATSKGEIPAA